MKNIFVLLVIILFSLNLFASESRQGMWFGTFAKKALNQKNSLWAETQLRYSLDDGGMQQFLYRTGWLRKMHDGHGFGLLYAFIQGKTTKEHRFTVQHTQKYGSLGNYTFSSRTRFEQRIQEDNPDTSRRFRYLIRGDKKLWGDYGGAFWNEIFVNLTKDDWTGNRLIDRNRFFMGLNHKLYDSKMEFGYLNQYVSRTTQNIVEHLAVFYLFF